MVAACWIVAGEEGKDAVGYGRRGPVAPWRGRQMRNPNPRSRREGALSPCSRWGGGARASELGNGVETGDWVGWGSSSSGGLSLAPLPFGFLFRFFCVGPWKGILLGYPSPLGITVKRAVCSFNLVL
jgi:hypothetical protein